MTDEPRIVATASEFDAGMIRGALSEAGIRTMLSPVGYEVVNGGGTWNVFVPAHSYAAAKHLLDDMRSNASPTADADAQNPKKSGVFQSLEELLGIGEHDDQPPDPFGRSGR